MLLKVFVSLRKITVITVRLKFKEKPVKLKCFNKLNFLLKIANAMSRENTAIGVGKLKKVNQFHFYYVMSTQD